MNKNLSFNPIVAIFSILLILSVSLTGCDNQPQISKEDKVFFDMRIQQWLLAYNDSDWDKQSQHFADVVDYFGQRAPKTSIQNLQRNIRNSHYSVEFQAVADSFPLDSVVETTYFTHIKLEAQSKKESAVNEETLLTIGLEKINEKFLITHVEGGIKELALKVEQKAKRAHDAEGIIDNEGEINIGLMEETIKEITGDFDDFAFYTQLDNNRNYFYVTKFLTDDPDFNYDDLFYKGHLDRIKMGVIDISGKPVLPVEYDFIGHFGLLMRGVAEIRKDGKYGLIDEDFKIILQPKYDVIYPPVKGQKNFLIIQEGEQFSKYVPGKALEPYQNPGDGAPSLKELTQNWSWEDHLDMNEDYKGTFLVPCDKKMYFAYIGKMLSSPGFLIEMGISKDYVIVENYEPGESELVTPREVLNLDDGLFGLITKMEEWSYGPRYEFYSRKYKLVTYDGLLNKLGSQELYTYSEDEYMGTACEVDKQERIGKDTLMVMYSSWLDSHKYSNKPVYKFYVIEEGGKVRELKFNREFPFTGFTEIDERYFKGCFQRLIPDEDRELVESEEMLEYTEEYEITRHLDMEDLDIMRNEIFASYGYQFQKQKWQDYFNQKDWYEPAYSNVDTLLSPIDSANVQFILQYQKKMKGKEDQYTKPERRQHYMM